MIRSPTLAQSWPVATDRVQISAAVVRSHLLANPQGMTISEIVDRTGMIQSTSDKRRLTSPYIASVRRVLADMEDIGVVVEAGDRWYDTVTMERMIEKRRRIAKEEPKAIPDFYT